MGVTPQQAVVSNPPVLIQFRGDVLNSITGSAQTVHRVSMDGQCTFTAANILMVPPLFRTLTVL